MNTPYTPQISSKCTKVHKQWNTFGKTKDNLQAWLYFSMQARSLKYITEEDSKLKIKSLKSLAWKNKNL